MTRNDTLTILSVLKAAYPAFYKSMNRLDADATIDLWATMFEDDPVAVVAAAVKTLIAADTKGYPPNIGSVKEQIRKLTVPETMTEAEAWGAISKAVRNSLYSSQREFEKLPDGLKSLVGSPAQLREWAAVDVDTLQTVIASNFQRSYRAKIAAERETAVIPGSVRKALSGFTDHIALDPSVTARKPQEPPGKESETNVTP